MGKSIEEKDEEDNIKNIIDILKLTKKYLCYKKIKKKLKQKKLIQYDLRLYFDTEITLKDLPNEITIPLPRGICPFSQKHQPSKTKENAFLLYVGDFIPNFVFAPNEYLTHDEEVGGLHCLKKNHSNNSSLEKDEQKQKLIEKIILVQPVFHPKILDRIIRDNEIDQTTKEECLTDLKKIIEQHRFTIEKLQQGVKFWGDTTLIGKAQSILANLKEDNII